MSVWQPIETAPKDGTEIQVRNPQITDGPVLAKFGVYYSNFMGKSYPNRWVVTRDHRFPAIRSGDLVIPTEWMPLPLLRTNQKRLFPAGKLTSPAPS